MSSDSSAGRVIRRFVLVAAIAGLLGPIGVANSADDTQPRLDLYNDPLPAAASVRLGTVRYRAMPKHERIAFAADDRTIIIGDQTGRIGFWSVTDGRLSSTTDIREPSETLYEMRMTPERHSVLVIGRAFDPGRSCTIREWDVKTGRLRREFSKADPFDGQKYDVTPDGRYIFCASQADEDEGKEATLGVWDLEANRTNKVRIPDCGIPVSISSSPDGGTLVVKYQQELCLWKWRTQAKPQIVVPGSNEFTPAFSPKVTQVWDLERHELKHEFDGMLSEELAVSSDSRWLAATGNGRRIRVWDLQTGKDVESDYPGHDREVDSIRFAPNGRTVVTTGDDNTLRIWDPATGRQSASIEHDVDFRSLTMPPDGRVTLAPDYHGKVLVIETETGRKIGTFPGLEPLSRIGPVVCSPDGTRFVAWSGDYRLRIRDLANGDLISEKTMQPTELRIPKPGNGIEFDKAVLSPDTTRLAVQHQRGVSVVETTTGGQLGRVELQNESLITGLALTPDGVRIASSVMVYCEPVRDVNGRQIAFDNVIRVTDIRSQADVWRVTLADASAGPITISDDGRLLAAVTAHMMAGARLHIFDMATGQERFSTPNLPGDACCVAFSPDGTRVACGLTDSTALIWDLGSTPKK